MGAEPGFYVYIHGEYDIHIENVVSVHGAHTTLASSVSSTSL